MAAQQQVQAETMCADAAIEAAVRGGVSLCFANPGTTELQLVAALERRRGAVRSILCLHEGVCTGAADGFARLARRPALALLHLGPGLGNGLSMLHNARRARSPVLVVVGEHATWHRAADPPLAQDIQALAGTVGAVVTVSQADGVAAALEAALGVATGPSSAAAADGREAAAPGVCAGSRVVTVVLPHDIAWSPAPAQLRPAERQAPRPSLRESAAARRFIADCAAALQAAPRGKAALLLGGVALLEDGGALAAAGRIAATLGAALLCEPLPGRIRRGAGLPHCRRLPYFPQEAAAELRQFEVLLLLDVRRPVATFGYKDGPSQLLCHPDSAVFEVDESWGTAEALALLADALPGAAHTVAAAPGVSGGSFAAAGAPPVPTGPLTAAALCQAVAALQPADTILVDESLTSGSSYWEASKGCPRFDHLCLTGGAIGCGLPLAVGAAVAAPGRRVIVLQADGSAAYTLQALWTQAREQLPVLTLICANNSYAILQVEAMRQRSGPTGSLTSLAGPELDWVALAAGFGVAGGRATDCEALVRLLREGLAQPGPFLIHAVLK